MSWVLLALFCALLVELAVRLPFVPILTRARTTTGKALHVFGSRAISEHWKEKVMLTYSLVTLGCSLGLAGLLIVLGVAALLLVLAFDLLDPTFSGLVTSGWGIAVSVGLACLYLPIRRFLPHARVQPAGQDPASPGPADRIGR